MNHLPMVPSTHHKGLSEMLTLADTNTMMVVVRVAHPYGVDPLGSSEAEVFFNELLSRYEEPTDQASLSEWLNHQLAELFTAVGDRPRWIQNPEWQFADGKPMVFAGQINIPK